MGSQTGLCPYGVGFAIFVVQIIAIMFIVKKRPTKRRSQTSLIALLVVVFATLAIIDVPTALGRCPVPPPPPESGAPPETPLDQPFRGPGRFPPPEQEGLPESDTSTGLASLGAVPLFYGLAYGLLSFTSPCGLPLIPAYILYYLGKKVTVGRGFYGGFSVTFGLLTAFTLLGVIISATGIALESYVEIFEFMAAVVTLVMGVFLLRGIRIPFFRAPKAAMSHKGVLGLFTFGTLWGIAVISCSPYLFIPLVFYSLTLGVIGIQAYIGYALGLGLPVITIALLISVGRRGMVSKFIELAPSLNRLSGIFLVIIGSSLLLYTYVLKPANLSFEILTAFLLLLTVSIFLIAMKNLLLYGDIQGLKD